MLGLELFANVHDDCALAGKATGFDLGVDRFIIHGDLKGSSHGGDQSDLFQTILVLIKQLMRQTGGSWEVPSRGAVTDTYLCWHVFAPSGYATSHWPHYTLTPALEQVPFQPWISENAYIGA
jgi:hypothetical protein